MFAIPQELIWTIVVGFILAFILAFGIGANDVANSFGTSVGSRVLTLKQACILACIFETLGAVLLGAKVSDTIRKGIIDVGPYENNTELLLFGNVAALAGSCTWLIGATLLRLPVSATHSIVGATVGFALVAHGLKGINWVKLGMIIGSWFISPVLAGMVSVGIFYLCKYFILTKEDPLEPGLRFLPVFYAITLVINLFSVFYDGPEMLGFDKIPTWGAFILAFGGGIICAILVRQVVVPWQRKRIKDHIKELNEKNEYKPAIVTESGDIPDDDEKATLVFEYPSPPSSTNTSIANSQNNSVVNSRKNSLDGTEKSTLETISENNHLNNAANNFLTPPEISTGKQMNNNSKTPEKKSNLKKLNKAEEASLVDNEYKLGTVTPNGPSRNNTTDNLQKLNGHGDSNGTVVVIENKMDSEQNPNNRTHITDRPETAKLFSFLQILTAIFGAFAHGGNDVSNAISPLVSLWLIAVNGNVVAKAMTPPWILLYGGVGISLGLCLLGRRVIKTIGDDLTKITPSSGFSIEVGSALTVLIASNIGIPISTTHCKVGSVVCVGRFRSRENVDWRIFRNIVLAWLVTLPITGSVAAAIMAGLQLLV